MADEAETPDIDETATENAAADQQYVGGVLYRYHEQQWRSQDMRMACIRAAIDINCRNEVNAETILDDAQKIFSFVVAEEA